MPKQSEAEGSSLRLVFLGSPEPAVVVLRALVDAGHDVALVVTRPDTRRGRGGELSPTPVKFAATELGVAVSHDVGDVAATGAELGVVVAYGRIIRPEVLAAVPMINLHFSLLPRWRGAAPVERAILAGDAVTGVCLMRVEEGLDTGAVYRRWETPIHSEETAAELTARLATAGARLLVGALAEGLGSPRPQEGVASYAGKVDPADLRLDWRRSAVELHRVVRAGRAWTTWRGRRLLVLDARVLPDAAVEAGRPVADTVGTGAGALRLVTVQPEGKRPQSGIEWARGARPGPHERLGE